MKTVKFFAGMTALFLMLTASLTFAQPEKGNMPPGRAPHEMMMKDKTMPPAPPMLPIPDLTTEQAEQIKKLNIENDKTNQPIENSINELEAKLRTVTTGDNASMDQALKLIDEITPLRAKIMKNNIKTHLEIRKLLTDEQKVVFDKQPPMEKRMHPKTEMKHQRSN